MAAERNDLVAALGHSLKAIDDDYKEEMRELRTLFAEAKKEAEKDEPDSVKLKALLADANEMPSIEGDMRRLGYDQYRALRPRPDSALWRDGKGLFRAEFFPAGFIYDKPVQIFVVDGGTTTPVALSPDQFDFSDSGLKTLP